MSPTVSKNIDIPPNKHIIYPLAISGLFFMFSFHLIGRPIIPGLDPSYEAALNYFFDNNIFVGKDIFFTYGPLGFLLVPQPVGHNILFGTVFYTLILLGFILCYFQILFSTISNTNRFLQTAVLIISFFLGNVLVYFGTGEITVALIVLLICIADKWNLAHFLFIAAFLSAFMFLVKPAYTILSLAFLISYILIRYPSTKKIKMLLSTAGTALLCLVVLWSIAVGSIITLYNFVIATLELSSGNSSAMSKSASMNWIPFVIALLLICIFILSQPSRVKKFSFIFLLPMAVWFKYSFSRVGHAPYFLVLIFIMLTILFIYADSIKHKMYCLLLLIISMILVTITINSLPYFHTKDFLMRHIKKSFYSKRYNNFSTIFKIRNFEKNINNYSKKYLQNYVIDKKILNTISQAPVDIYPWETAYVFANSLNWHPRPVFQSYIAYTPWLDAKNADFIKSTSAPDFILWNVKNNKNNFISIDNRYLLSDEPNTIFEIIRNYYLHLAANHVMLLSKSASPLFSMPEETDTITAAWEEWITIPEHQETILRAKTFFQRTFFGRVKRLLYKEREMFIDYKLCNGKVVTHRIVPDNAISGIWISPYITPGHLGKPNDPLKQTVSNGRVWLNGEKVIAVRYRSNDQISYLNEFMVTWELITPSDV